MALTLIAIGSHDPEQINSVDYYDSELDKWIELVILDVGTRVQFKSEMLNGKLMLVGGFQKGASSTLQAYDFLTDTLTTLAPMNIPRYGHEVAVVEGYLYAIGGYGEDYLNTVERYDPSADVWTEGQPMPTARYNFGMAVNDSVIYVIGGYSFESEYYSVVESYDPSLDTWKTCTPMKEKRDQPGVASIGNFIYAVGGHDGLKSLMTVEKYDPITDSWTYIESISGPRFAGVSINYNDTIILAGGFNPHMTDLVETYDNDWTISTPLASPRAYFSLVKVPWTLIKQTRRSKL